MLLLLFDTLSPPGIPPLLYPPLLNPRSAETHPVLNNSAHRTHYVIEHLPCGRAYLCAIAKRVTRAVPQNMPFLQALGRRRAIGIEIQPARACF